MTDQSLPYLAWFSHGAASAVATALALSTYGKDNVEVINTGHLSEHPDNARFRAEVADWLGVEIREIHSDRYEDHWHVIAARRFVNGPHGALCTTELKKKPRWAVQDAFGPQVYGYTADRKDAERADRFREQNPEVTLITPLIERGLTKADCLGLLLDQGIEVPAMYRLGYHNNNCIGCVKGGMGYWNKIRVDFPEVFDRMAKLEREVGSACIHTKEEGPVFLDVLDPKRGNYAEEQDMECSLLCAAASIEIEDGAA